MTTEGNLLWTPSLRDRIVCKGARIGHLHGPHPGHTEMPFHRIIWVLLLAPALLQAQRTCSLPATKDATSGLSVYPACATDRPARIADMSYPVRYPEVLRSAGITPHDPQIVIVTIDPTGQVVRSETPLDPSRSHPGFINSIGAALPHWRFDPAVRDGRPVATSDTLLITFPPAPPPLVPRGCVDCDPRLDSMQRVVSDLSARLRGCATFLRFVALWEPTDSTAKALDEVVDCPGAADAAVLAVRMEGAAWSGSGMRRYWVTLASRVRDPRVFEAAMEGARGRSRGAFRILAAQVGLRWTRVDDSLPGRWDSRRARPKTGCGPLRVTGLQVGAPVPAVDTLRLRRVLELADSIAESFDASESRRVTAWCLATQLR